MKKREQIIISVFIVIICLISHSIISLTQSGTNMEAIKAENISEKITSKNPIAIYYFDSQLIKYKLYLTDYENDRIPILDIQDTNIIRDDSIVINTEDEINKKIIFEDYIFTIKVNRSEEKQWMNYLQIYEIRNKIAQLKGEVFLLSKLDRYPISGKIGILDNKLCFVFIWLKEIYIIDCSDSLQPVLLMKYHYINFSSLINELKTNFDIIENYIIIQYKKENSGNEIFLGIIDFSDINSPEFDSEIDHGYRWRVVNNDFIYLYYPYNLSGLEIYNIKDKKNPELVALLENNSYIDGITAEDNFVYLLLNNSMLRIYQQGFNEIYELISEIELEKSEEISEYFFGGQIYRNRMIINRMSEDKNRTFSLIDIGNKENPKELIIFGPESGVTKTLENNGLYLIFSVICILVGVKRKKKQRKVF
ncbi:MAG TPA: hypothetical protein VMX55_12000 [candidate division Zixibacteria bacterium]|nr:hypothetical protein [candidate division Zixibacteria bacterium]